MNTYLVRYSTCYFSGEEECYVRIAENEHQIINELIRELKHMCNCEGLKWLKVEKSAKISIVTLSPSNVSNNLMNERYNDVLCAIKNGTITDSRSASKEFVLGREYEAVLLNNSYYINEYHMIWVPYEDYNFMRVLRTDDDYISDLYKFNMFKNGDKVCIKCNPEKIYEIEESNIVDESDSYTPKELYWENYRRIVYEREVLYVNPSQLQLVERRKEDKQNGSDLL